MTQNDQIAKQLSESVVSEASESVCGMFESVCMCVCVCVCTRARGACVSDVDSHDSQVSTLLHVTSSVNDVTVRDATLHAAMQ